MALLEVEDLHVSFRTPDGVVQAVRGVSFDVEPGQTLGIVGESGSGKSVATQTIIGLTRGARGLRARRSSTAATCSTHAAPTRCARIRGAKIGMIFQDPLSSLHPYYKVGWQIVEMIRLHDERASKAAGARAGGRAARSGRHPRADAAGSTTTRTSSPAACGSGR